MVLPQRITFPDLMETARTFPLEVRTDPVRQTFTLAAPDRRLLAAPHQSESLVRRERFAARQPMTQSRADDPYLS